MSTSNLPCRPCVCDEKLTAAEAELRSKGKSNRELQSQYFAAAAEVERVILEHFRECPCCQSAELAHIAVAGKGTGVAHAS
jgi:hypothetical protein